jgi:hypothetical protein
LFVVEGNGIILLMKELPKKKKKKGGLMGYTKKKGKMNKG